MTYLGTRKGELSPESTPGKIYYQILSDTVAMSNGNVFAELQKMGVSITANNVSGQLLSLVNRKFANRKQIGGKYHYTKRLSGAKQKSTQETLVGFSKEISEHLPTAADVGGKIGSLINSLRGNIGKPLPAKGWAASAGIPFNSSVLKNLKTLSERGVVSEDKPSYSSTALFTPLPTIATYSHAAHRQQPGAAAGSTRQHLQDISAHQPRLSPAPMRTDPNAAPDLVNAFQQILDQSAQNQA